MGQMNPTLEKGVQPPFIGNLAPFSKPFEFASLVYVLGELLLRWPLPLAKAKSTPNRTQLIELIYK